MSTNISKQKREDLLAKIKEIRTFISSAPQDENTGNLISYLSDLEKDVNGKKYGLVFEEHREEIDEVLDTHTPVLTEDADLFIDNGGQVNCLIEGDNYGALKVLQKTHRGKIDLIYIDPPYNTGAKDWKYSNDYVDSNDTFRHSKWLSMMNVRLLAAKTLLTSDGALVCAIDENEQATTGLLLEEIFGEAYNIDCITVVHNPGGIQGANFSYCHEYAYFVYPRRSYYIKKERREGDDLTPFRDWGKENSKRTGSPNCFYPIITDGEKILSFGDVPPEDFHPTQFVTYNEETDDKYHYTLSHEIMPGDDFLSSLKNARTTSALKLTVSKEDIKDDFMQFADRNDIDDEVEIWLKRPKGAKKFPDNLIKAYYDDLQSNNRIKKISVKGTNASGQFEIDTDLMKMKHYLSVAAEAVTNEVNSLDFFRKAQEFIEETRNKK